MQKFPPIVYLNESKMPGIVYFPGLSPFAHPLKRKTKTPEIQIGYRTTADRTQKKEKVDVSVFASLKNSSSRVLAGMWAGREESSRDAVPRGVDLVAMQLNVSENRGVLGLLL